MNKKIIIAGAIALMACEMTACGQQKKEDVVPTETTQEIQIPQNVENKALYEKLNNCLSVFDQQKYNYQMKLEIKNNGMLATPFDYIFTNNGEGLSCIDSNVNQEWIITTRQSNKPMKSYKYHKNEDGEIKSKEIDVTNKITFYDIPTLYQDSFYDYLKNIMESGEIETICSESEKEIDGVTYDSVSLSLGNSRIPYVDALLYNMDLSFENKENNIDLLFEKDSNNFKGFTIDMTNKVKDIIEQNRGNLPINPNDMESYMVLFQVLDNNDIFIPVPAEMEEGEFLKDNKTFLFMSMDLRNPTEIKMQSSKYGFEYDKNMGMPVIMDGHTTAAYFMPCYKRLSYDPMETQYERFANPKKIENKMCTIVGYDVIDEDKKEIGYAVQMHKPGDPEGFYFFGENETELMEILKDVYITTNFDSSNQISVSPFYNWVNDEQRKTIEVWPTFDAEDQKTDPLTVNEYVDLYTKEKSKTEYDISMFYVPLQEYKDDDIFEELYQKRIVRDKNGTIKVMQNNDYKKSVSTSIYTKNNENKYFEYYCGNISNPDWMMEECHNYLDVPATTEEFMLSMPKYDLIEYLRANQDKFRLKEETENFNGKECYVVEAEIPAEYTQLITDSPLEHFGVALYARKNEKLCNFKIYFSAYDNTITGENISYNYTYKDDTTAHKDMMERTIIFNQYKEIEIPEINGKKLDNNNTASNKWRYSISESNFAVNANDWAEMTIPDDLYFSINPMNETCLVMDENLPVAKIYPFYKLSTFTSLMDTRSAITSDEPLEKDGYIARISRTNKNVGQYGSENYTGADNQQETGYIITVREKDSAIGFHMVGRDKQKLIDVFNQMQIESHTDKEWNMEEADFPDPLRFREDVQKK